MIKNQHQAKSNKSIKTSNSNDQIFDSNTYSIKSKSQKSVNQEQFFRTQSSPDILETNDYFQIEDNESETSFIQSHQKSLFSKNSDKIFYNFFVDLISKWIGQKALYLAIQKSLIIINFLLTLTILGLSLWVNIDDRFVIITNLANSILYTSFNLVISFLAYEFLSISSISLVLDIINFVYFSFVKKFLDSHTQNQILAIIKNQRVLTNIRNDFNEDYEIQTLKRRIKIRRSLKTVLLNLKFLLLIQVLVSVFVFFGVSFFNALFLHFKKRYIISYELPQTLIKVIREYEKQQRSALIRNDQVIFRFRNIYVNTTEENLINRINTRFNCCNYQNPYQYGELAPLTCNFDRGCLKPMQDFLWNYIYTAVIVLLFVGSLKFLIQTIIMCNFYIIFFKRLIRKVYFVNVRKLFDNESDDDDETDGLVKKRKHDIIRKQKEERLTLEEEQEIQKEYELTKNLFLDKKQEEYEKMLLKQKRFKELKFEQMQRRLQNQHLLQINQE